QLVGGQERRGQLGDGRQGPASVAAAVFLQLGQHSAFEEHRWASSRHGSKLGGPYNRGEAGAQSGFGTSVNCQVFGVWTGKLCTACRQNSNSPRAKKPGFFEKPGSYRSAVACCEQVSFSRSPRECRPRT